MKGLEERRLGAVEKLLRLFDHDEIVNLCETVGVDAETDIDKLLHVISELPRFRALQFALNAANPTISMLKDITFFLEANGISARTTGFTLALGNPSGRNDFNRIDLSKQQTSVVCSFSPKDMRKIGDDPFLEADDDWNELSSEWQSLISDAEPKFARGRLRIVESYLEGYSVFGSDRDRSDDDAQHVLMYLLSKLRTLENILGTVDEKDRSSAMETFSRSISRMVHKIRRGPLRDKQSFEIERVEKPETYTFDRYVSNNFLNKFDRLNEDVRALAGFSSTAGIFDLLKISMWSTRPQLYEVWLLTCIINWFSTRGYIIDLLGLTKDSSSKTTWQLSYASSTRPCAIIRRGKEKFYLFFQLFSPTGDMPDISLLSDEGPDSTPLWSIDAKHSQKSGYSASQYLKTAIRYRDSFGAPLSLIVEYFPREDISVRSNKKFIDGIQLITNAGPNGNGMSQLFASLDVIHPVLKQSILCLDFSSSFSSRLCEATQRALKSLQGLENNLLDSYVAFAGEAILKDRLHDMLPNTTLLCKTVHDLRDGTSVLPVIQRLKQLSGDAEIACVIVISDGQFSESNWKHLIEVELECTVQLFS